MCDCDARCTTFTGTCATCPYVIHTHVENRERDCTGDSWQNRESAPTVPDFLNDQSYMVVPQPVLGTTIVGAGSG